MQKPTKQKIENASKEQLAEWSAVYVMGWKKQYITRYAGSGYAHLNIKNRFQCWADSWNPAENIQQSMELVEEVRKYQYVVCMETPVLNWHVSFFKQVGGIDGEIICYHNENEILSKAITIAALLAVVVGK